MKILVLGQGAREHAIVKALLRTGTPASAVVVAPGNAGIGLEVACEPTLNANSPADVTEFARSAQIDLVIIGPEAPLVAGVADSLRAAGLPVFGPDQSAAALEGSKAFAKEIMAAANVPTGAAERCTTLAEVQAPMDRFGAPFVIKADGLAAGKGVLVTEDPAAALAHAEKFITGGILVEEFLAGQEVSLFFLADGKHVTPLTPAQDFKRAFDGDLGPNTGGMGAYSPLPWLPAGFVEEVQAKVAEPTIAELARRGTPFVGLLYCGLIITAKGVRVIEFNARFGDPETQVVLKRLTSPLAELLLAASLGRLNEVAAPSFTPDAAITVVLASEGYPDSSAPNRPLHGLAAAEREGVEICHAATAWAASATGEEVLLATGGRVLSVVAMGADFGAAREQAYCALAQIELAGGHYRRDIAAQVA